MKRQNVLDVSISQVSASVSDHSRITGFKRQITTTNVDHETMTNEAITPFALELIRMRSNDHGLNGQVKRDKTAKNLFTTGESGEFITMQTNPNNLQPILSEGQEKLSDNSDPFDLIDGAESQIKYEIPSPRLT